MTGVIAASAGRYGDQPGDPTARLQATFEAAPEHNGRSHLVLLDGANHFSFAHPADPSTGRAFLEGKAGLPGDKARALMARLVTAFARRCFESEGEAIADIVSAHEDCVAGHRAR